MKLPVLYLVLLNIGYGQIKTTRYRDQKVQVQKLMSGLDLDRLKIVLPERI